MTKHQISGYERVLAWHKLDVRLTFTAEVNIQPIHVR